MTLTCCRCHEPVPTTDARAHLATHGVTFERWPDGGLVIHDEPDVADFLDVRHA